MVFYTDAQYWRAQEGDFDEKTADEWDVDMSGYYESGISIIFFLNKERKFIYDSFACGKKRFPVILTIKTHYNFSILNYKIFTRYLLE